MFSVCKKNTQFVLADIRCPCTEYCIYCRYEVIGGDIVAWGLEFLFMIVNLQKAYSGESSGVSSISSLSVLLNLCGSED